MENLFGMNDRTAGVLMTLVGSFCNSIESVVEDETEDAGVSSNAISLYEVVALLLFIIGVDGYLYYVGYDAFDKRGNKVKVKWFVLTDIWTRNQRGKILEMDLYLFWIVVYSVFNYLFFVPLLLAYVFADNVGDAVAIFDLYPLFIPMFGFFLRKHYHYQGFRWRNRYLLSFALAIIGLFFVNRPGFLFGYSSEVDKTQQFLGCIFALVAGVFVAVVVISNTILETAAYAEYCKLTAASQESQQAGGTDHDTQLLLDENTPLRQSAASAASAASEASEASDAPNASNYLIGGADGADGAEDQTTVSRTRAQVTNESNDAETTDAVESADHHMWSADYIVLNEIGLLVFSIEIVCIVNILMCLVLAPLGLVGNNWVWQEFVLFYDDLSAKTIGYIVIDCIFSTIDSTMYIYGIFKLRDATLGGLLDVTDVVFTFLLSYLVLGQNASAYDISGSMLLVAAIIIAVYPWQRHSCVAKWW